MAHPVYNPGDREKSPLADASASVRADLVNGGQDTRITLRDGSIIVLKGVTRVEAVLLAVVQRPS